MPRPRSHSSAESALREIARAEPDSTDRRRSTNFSPNRKPRNSLTGIQSEPEKGQYTALLEFLQQDNTVNAFSRDGQPDIKFCEKARSWLNKERGYGFTVTDIYNILSNVSKSFHHWQGLDKTDHKENGNNPQVSEGAADALIPQFDETAFKLLKPFFESIEQPVGTRKSRAGSRRLRDTDRTKTSPTKVDDNDPKGPDNSALEDTREENYSTNTRSYELNPLKRKRSSTEGGLAPKITTDQNSHVRKTKTSSHVKGDTDVESKSGEVAGNDVFLTNPEVLMDTPYMFLDGLSRVLDSVTRLYDKADENMRQHLASLVEQLVKQV
ncbi:hypothetical protein NADFUDRAFT_41503 [Nadsonia fulvescens var. elongata DSM 6958]|uniref:Uncharacterized protein n=1 Tax=Nadsonia fulvescens var. elongata DSM 6958 TaxID=857566 RepID=A0A1E3PJX8_9ASCO|nr:hypothetical protein NADFUDRAFT_41503 [Nadsonia fulvescens var. elongata DSM 6958]